MILLPLASAALLFAQAAAGEAPVPASPPPLAQDRLTVCLKQARTDPATAIVTASGWAAEAPAEEASYPQHCLGVSYASLLRWEAAEAAFVKARDAVPADDAARRARLGAMAGNAALAQEDYAGADALLAAAQSDAETYGDAALIGEVAADRTRALVGAGNEARAAEVLAKAQVSAPQDAEVWLLSATLARREGDLDTAQGQIETAAALAPKDAEIALEAGLIAALSGRDEAARNSWQSVIALDPGSPQSTTARVYLARLAGRPETR